MPRLMALSTRLACLVLLSVWSTAKPAPSNLPSTVLNLPIPEALSKGDLVKAHVSDTARDQAIVEPTFRDNNIKDFLHQSYINFAHPVPIVDDTIKEEEKYGNTGDQLDAIGNVLVKGTEVGTQFLGRLITLPGDTVRTVSGKVTQALNRVGAFVIGL